jgi:hypothetical protein
MKIELKFKLVINDIGNKEVADIVGIRTVSNDEFLITKYKHTKVYIDNTFILVADMDGYVYVYYDVNENWWCYNSEVRKQIVSRYQILNDEDDDFDLFNSTEAKLYITNFIILGKNNKAVIKDNAILAKHDDNVYMWTKCEKGLMRNSVELNFFE